MLPAKRPRMRLDSTDRVRREAARLYAESKSGLRDTAEVGVLAGLLTLVAKLIGDAGARPS